MTDKINEEFKKNLIIKFHLETSEVVKMFQIVLPFWHQTWKYINGETIHVNGGMYMA